jgi:hypothetical protein
MNTVQENDTPDVSLDSGIDFRTAQRKFDEVWSNETIAKKHWMLSSWIQSVAIVVLVVYSIGSLSQTTA